MNLESRPANHLRKLRNLVVICFAVLAIGTVCVQSIKAQENKAPAAAEEAAPKKAPDNLLAATYEGLGPMYTVVFLLMSFWLVSMLVMNILAVRRENICPPDLIENVEKSLAENNTQGAVELIQSDDSMLAQIVSAGLGKLEKGREHAIEAMRQVGEEEVMNLKSER